MMELCVNGEDRKVPEAVTVSGLLEHLAMTGRRVAVEVNEDIVPRSEHAEYRLNPGDRVEIVHAIGGG